VLTTTQTYLQAACEFIFENDEILNLFPIITMKSLEICES